jgi:hypothetical protein
MSEKSGGNVVDSVLGVVRELNVVGLPAVLWTVVVCTALLKGENATLSWMWKDLYRTWLGLFGLWAAATAGLSVYRRFSKQLNPVPVIAEPRPPVAVVERVANE